VPELATLAAIPSVALFVERACEATPAFALTPDNAATVVELCQRLDGLPLALELAAARLSLLTPSALLARLEHRLPLLTRGARDLPQRQQTLRTTIAWSYDLLEAGEQQLFRRLAVFVGGFTLEAVRAICIPHASGASSLAQTEEGAALEQLAQLLDKSLVQALAWSKANEDGVETGLRLAGALYYYWFLLGYLYEGRTWLEGLLERTGSTDRSAARGKALLSAGWLAWVDGDFEAASPRAEKALSIVREAGDKRLTGRVESLLGFVQVSQGNTAAARPLLEESRTLFKDVGNVWSEAFTLYYLGSLAYRSSDPAAARAYYEESLRLFQEQRDVLDAALVLSALQAMVSTQGDQELAHSLHQQLQQLMQHARDRGALGLFLINFGDIWLHRLGEEQQAKVLYREGLSLWQEMQRLGNELGIVKGLAGLAQVAAAQGQAEQAGRLFGAAARLLPATSPYREEMHSRSAAARAHLDAATFEAGWTAGQAMTEEQAISFAIQDA